jgi:hypothetical protein
LGIALIVAGLGWGEASAALCPLTGPAPALQAQAQFLGSDDYYQAHGGTPRDLVLALYADVLGRPPTENEIQRWTSRLDDCGNGVVMAREFMIFAQSELAARYKAAPPALLVQPIYPVPAGQPLPYPIPGGFFPS